MASYEVRDTCVCVLIEQDVSRQQVSPKLNVYVAVVRLSHFAYRCQLHVSWIGLYPLVSGFKLRTLYGYCGTASDTVEVVWVLSLHSNKNVLPSHIWG